MTDKVQKIRKEVERLKRWNNNVRDSTRHMTLQEEDFNRGKHSSYLEILNFIDSLQEEPVSGLDNGNMPIERWKQAVEAASNQSNYRSSKGLTETRDDYFVDGVQWADEHQAEKDLTDKAKLSSGWDGFYYGQGYKQAEKDLELTWENIELIVNIDKDTDNEESIIGVRSNEEHFKEVLNRFNKTKE